MSRFIKQPHPSENAYVEFRFENSLRKYEQKPIKKIKCNEVCGHCTDRHKKKNTSTSPFSQRYPAALTTIMSKRLAASIDRQSAGDKLSEGHLVSSNKTIKLSKRKPLEDMSEGQKNNLQMKIYASLVNISKGDSKIQKSQEGRSELEEEVFLNDFEVSEGMEEQKDSEGEGDFGRIELSEKSEIKKEEQQQIKEEIIPYKESSQEIHLQEVEIAQELPLETNPILINQHIEVCQEANLDEKHQSECISARIQKLSVSEGEESKKPDIPEIPELQHPEEMVLEPGQPKLQHLEEPNQPLLLPLFPSEQPAHENQVNFDHSLHDHQDSFPSHQDISSHAELAAFSLKRQADHGIICSRIVESSELKDQMMDKCLYFQGGRIYFDGEGQHFYISTRVFNKLRKQCASISDLISTLIHQRPYLEGKKHQIQQQLQHYLSQ